jgi:cytochrome c oxidase assembly protein subunit 15
MQRATSSVPGKDHGRAVRLWLYLVAGLVVLMVLVGGATRLTQSGLSIVEWRPVTGALPPLSEADWAREFAKYQTSSQYRLLNAGMRIDGFKRIYWWEWSHRLLGRAIAVAFLLPFLVFLARGSIEPRLLPRLLLVLLLGGAEGGIGWWMVASGLAGRTEVAQERLAVHLAMACLILTLLIGTARGATAPAVAKPKAPARLTATAIALVVLIFLEIALGGLVAGLRAGLIFDTWPQIDGALIPSRDHLWILEPAWRNLLENPLTVQFAHRLVAYTLIVLAALHAQDCSRREPARRWGAIALAAALLLQAALGVAALLRHVPIELALAHQSLAILTLILATLHAGNLAGPSRTALPLSATDTRSRAA